MKFFTNYKFLNYLFKIILITNKFYCAQYNNNMKSAEYKLQQIKNKINKINNITNLNRLNILKNHFNLTNNKNNSNFRTNRFYETINANKKKEDFCLYVYSKALKNEFISPIEILNFIVKLKINEISIIHFYNKNENSNFNIKKIIELLKKNKDLSDLLNINEFIIENYEKEITYNSINHNYNRQQIKRMPTKDRNSRYAEYAIKSLNAKF